MRIVMVEWDDSYSYGGWHRLDKELDHVAVCVSVGLLCLEDKEQITIAQNKSMTSGNIADTLSIPRGCIKRIRYLKVG